MATRKDFINKIKQQLDDLDRECERLDLKAGKAREEIRHEWETRKLALREQRQQLLARLEEAGQATDSAWESVRLSLLEARQKFAQGVQDIRQTLGR